MMKRILAFFVVGLLAAASAANTWYVDDAKYGASGAGDSLETAFGTIQEAITRASAGDTVLVAPGVYNRDVDTSCGRNRVYVSKRLTIESLGDRSNTVIEGYSDPNSEHHGMTDGVSVRCVCVATGGNGTILKGFTLRNGATQWNGGAEKPMELACGGGFYAATGSSSTSFLVDCAIENCSGSRGGGMRYGNAVRTYFRNNYGHNNGAGAREASTYFCDFSGHTGGAPMLGWPKAVVHCSIGNNNIQLMNNTTITVRNTLMIPGSGGTSGNTYTWSGCVTAAATLQGTVEDTTLLHFGGAGSL